MGKMRFKLRARGYRHSCFNFNPNFAFAIATNYSRSRASFESVGCSQGSVVLN